MAQTSPSKSTSRPAIDLRKYIRLKNVFPVEFAVVHSPEDLLDIYWQQGYTCNVSQGGICLETVTADEEVLHRLQGGKAYLELRIHIPLGYQSIRASAEADWFKRVDEDIPGKYYIGLEFTSIAPSDLKRIIGYARRLQFSSRAAAAVSIFLFAVLVISGVYNYRLRMANKSLIRNLVAVQQEEAKTYAMIEEVVTEGNIVLDQIKQYTGDGPGRKELKQTYEELIRSRNRISDSLAILAHKKGGLRKTVVEKMHLWLKNHQNHSTGLILSFEGDADIKDWAFVYDQALAAHVFLSFGNEQGARKILNFFNNRAKSDFQGFYNGYYYDSGEVAEFTVYCGSNTWVGIAALQYIHKTGDKYYLPLARTVTDWLITMQEGDPDGGIKGGPEQSWFATEHNLDAYALFHMMYQVTEEEKYRTARDKVLSWLKAYALVPHGKEYKSPPINRGKGDATVATDTYAWALAAIGPEKLKKMGMDPEEIMKFAEEHCGVEVKYERPSGIVLDVRGFDFTKYANMPRGGMISPEWTSQMIVSFRMLSDYFAKKGDIDKTRYYETKAEIYLNELNKLIISSPSAKGQGEGCLPYATSAGADTGHGWNTPDGANTCSIAGTAYMIMAIRQWNPLMLEQDNINSEHGGTSS